MAICQMLGQVPMSVQAMGIGRRGCFRNMLRILAAATVGALMPTVGFFGGSSKRKAPLPTAPQMEPECSVTLAWWHLSRVPLAASRGVTFVPPCFWGLLQTPYLPPAMRPCGTQMLAWLCLAAEHTFSAFMQGYGGRTRPAASKVG